MRALLDEGRARPDPLCLGLDVTDNLNLIGDGGHTSSRLFVLGPPTRSAFWEIIAVPDIRKQGRAFAARLFPG
ncbi:hypothetical protein D3874_26635 [Oleomonas cavernae]|uniref:Uncharacterized protein n=1 Tax=Oleomonas cavernae TaxID=2320859 RepID=A0A418VU36_9PROT|nr:hypothetical protein [Oleomonas cavernae]RJF80678.1 hypothetical protein D3874_26635 [Oleomonas cavernae]